MKLELLAPGGSPEGMRAALNAGADAVYMGGQKFGARAFAHNPSPDELLEALDYCHIRNKKLYLTVNTLLKERELEHELYHFLKPLYERGLDAVLVQDFGAFSFIKQEFPDLALHASTQMTLTGPDGARLLKRMGAERIVPSRELSAAEIADLYRQTGLEVECFVHGALCYCYSGQCLMSSLIGGRSGNRGRCAQPCRLPYRVFSGNKQLNSGNRQYLLSLKDICTLSVLPELIEAGVCSFKIEGRMKKPEYAAGVASVYRKYIDLYEVSGREQYRVDSADEQFLMDLYNRGGFSKGFYHMRNGASMMSMERPNHVGTPAARVLSVSPGKKGMRLCKLKASEQLYFGDILENEAAAGNSGIGWTIRSDIPKGKEFILQLSGKEAEALKTDSRLARVRCEKQLEEIRKDYLEQEKKVPVDGIFILQQNQQACLTVFCGEYSVRVFGDQPSDAINKPIDEASAEKQLRKTGGTPFIFRKLDISLDDQLFYPVQAFNAIRRSALAQLQDQILASFQRSAPSNKGKNNISFEEYSVPQEYDDSRKQSSEKNLPDEQRCLNAYAEQAEQAYVLAEIPEIKRIYLDICMGTAPDRHNRDHMRAEFFDLCAILREKNKQVWLAFPYIWRRDTRKRFEEIISADDLSVFGGIMLRSSDQLSYVKDMEEKTGKKLQVMADAGLYTWNQRAREQYAGLGVTEDTLPLELKRIELSERGTAGSECIVYGYLPLMISASCVKKNMSGCHHTPEILMMKDRKNAEFLIKNQCSFCYNMIYNSVPQNLLVCSKELEQLPLAGYRLSFTTETAEETKKIAEAAVCALGFSAGRKKQSDVCQIENGSRGHWKRGVE